MAPLNPTHRGSSALRRADLEIGYPEGGSPLDLPVESVMRFPTVVVEDTPLLKGIDLLLRGGVGLLVVVDEHRRPLGVVLPIDVISAMKRCGGNDLEALTVLQAARSGGRFMPESSSVRSAHAALSEENREFFVVVTREGRLAGILTALDVLQALDDTLPPASTTRPVAPLRGLR